MPSSQKPRVDMLFLCLLLLQTTTTVGSSRRKETVCSHQSKVLTCDSGAIIGVISAKIENPADPSCIAGDGSQMFSSAALLLCEKSKSFQAVKYLCEERETCRVELAKCSGHLTILYECSSKVTTTTTTTTTTTRTSSEETEMSTWRGCPSTINRGILWPRTQPGNFLEQKCPEHYEGRGGARWLCNEDGVWVGEPDLFPCVRSSLLRINEELTEHSLHLEGNDTFVKLIEFAGEVITGGDVKTFCDILMKLIRLKLRRHFLPSLLEVLGRLLDERNLRQWMEIPESLSHLWTFLVNLSAIVSLDVNDLYFDHENIEFRADGVVSGFACTEGSTEEFLDLSASTKDGAAHLTSKSCRGADHPDSIAVVNFRSAFSLLGGNDKKQFMSNLLLVATKYDDWTASENKPNLTIILKLNRLALEKVSCFQWSPFTNSSAADGCKHLWSNDSHVSCQCSSPSAFVAMETSGTSPSVDPQVSTSHPIAVYIGCTLCICGLVVSGFLYAFITFRQKKDIRYAVYLNYCICHAVNVSLTLVGLSRTKLEQLCTASSLILHYSSLVSLMWMLCGSFNVYLCLVRVKGKSSVGQEAWFYVVSFTLPLIVLVISASLNFESYKSSYGCWLSNTQGFEWAFIGPVVIILWFSAALNCVSWRTLQNSLNEVDSINEKNRLLILKSGLKHLIALIILSNLSWFAWLMHVYLLHLFFAYLYSVFCTIVGSLVLYSAAIEVKVVNQYFEKSEDKSCRRSSATCL